MFASVDEPDIVFSEEAVELTIPTFILPIAICLARVCDVTLGTLRTVAVVRGRVMLASILGFFEVVIWVVAVGKVITTLDNPLYVFAYASGYALGNAVGILIERKIALGQLVLRIISRDSGEMIAAVLRDRGFRVTAFDGRGRSGPVVFLYTVVQRADAEALKKLVEELDPDVFIESDDSRGANRLLLPTMVPATGWRGILGRK